ncbi:MAG: type I DNA topoisomerase [Ureaplasma sp.]|nr:type I DNA topoisomerase [Ureaplasma sp.]
MSKSLIIVESPNKTQTIKSYLGKDFDVVATYGHLRELNKKKGFQSDSFDPIWEVVKNPNTNSKSRSKQDIINEIVKKANIAERIYLATDPDREGEAIAWHVYDIIGKENEKKCKRITFNEVTKKAILAAIADEHEIDMNLVHSQFTRRILDRIIGYKLSSYVKAMLRAQSAGRVQSVALLFVVERELERRAFVPTFWWEISADLKNGIILDYIDYHEKYSPYNNSRTVPFRFAIEAESNEVYNSLSNSFKLEEISEPRYSTSDTRRPITTDKLLQLGANNLGWNTTKTTSVAQKMFEGIEYNSKHIGLISYPRTDSERLNDDFVNDCKDFIVSSFGDEYFENIKTKKAKSDVKIQDAHEAIRPVDIRLTPSDLALDSSVPSEILKLYNVVWLHTISCLMKPPVYKISTFMFDNNNHKFVYNHREIFFKGYKILFNDDEQSENMPNFKVGDVFETDKIDLEKHEKQPPSYYTEATLIAALKDAGVGRPSTYSSMAKIGESRGYINKDKQKLIPNQIGIDLIGLLTKHFGSVISKKFTAKMETDLDKIANGDENWKTPLFDFNDKFSSEIKQAYENTEKVKDEETGEICPDCGHNLVYKMSRYRTKFIGCSNYPNCKYIKSMNVTKKADKICPDCGNDLLIKTNKKGQEFIGCSNYPNCKHVESIEKK